MEFLERINLQRAKYLLSSETIDDVGLKKYLAVIIAVAKKNDGIFKCQYKTAKSLPPNFGRLYPVADYRKNGTIAGLCMINREARSYLASEHYIDIDMKKAHWYILRHLLAKYHLDVSLVDTVIDTIPKLKLCEGQDIITDSEELKKRLFSCLYSQPSFLGQIQKSILEGFPQLGNLHCAVYETLLPTLKHNYPDLYKILQKDRECKGNQDGSFVSHILQHFEKTIIQDIIATMPLYSLEVGCIIFDGILVSKQSAVGVDLDSVFEKVYNDLAAKYIGLKATLVVKPWPEWPEDWPLEIATKAEGTSSYAKLSKCLIDFIIENKLLFNDPYVLKQDDLHPMRYNIFCKTYRDLIVLVLSGNMLYKESGSFFEQLISLLEKKKSAEIISLEYDLNWIAFRNGALKLDAREFVALEDIPTDSKIIARHYIDSDFNPNCFETPLLDRILMYQLNGEYQPYDDPDAMRWFYIFVARLFFPPANDSFQVIPYVHGLSNTGKSTIKDILTTLFRPGSVGTIDSSMEKVFGLDNFSNSEVILVSDAPQDMALALSAEKFKQMVSGEVLNMPVKNKKSQIKQWTIPLMIMSNYLPNWGNENGAISKRLALFKFQNNIDEAKEDSGLKNAIIEQELGPIINKALSYYNEVKYIKKGFKNIAPDYFKNTTSEYCESVDTLFSFLNQTDNENNGIIYKLIFDKDKYVLLSEVEQRHMMYCKYTKQKSTWTKGDGSTFAKFNCKVEPANICKSCSRKAKIGCCPSYAGGNRKKLYVVQGLSFESETVSDTETGYRAKKGPSPVSLRRAKEDLMSL